MVDRALIWYHVQLQMVVRTLLGGCQGFASQVVAQVLLAVARWFLGCCWWLRPIRTTQTNTKKASLLLKKKNSVIFTLSQQTPTYNSTAHGVRGSLLFSRLRVCKNATVSTIQSKKDKILMKSSTRWHYAQRLMLVNTAGLLRFPEAENVIIATSCQNQCRN